jgi:hypothetical protein
MIFQEKVWGGKKTQYKTQCYLLPFNCKFTIMMRPRMTNNLLFELLKQINMVLLHMFCHRWHAITLTISNEDFVAPCAQGQNIKAWCFFMTNNASHNLRLLQINLLIIIYFEERPSGQNPLVRLPPKQLFFHGFQQYLLIHKILLANIVIWLCHWKSFTMLVLLP